MKKLYHSQAVRYVFFGGCTTMVNLVTYYLLRQMLGVDITAANLASISLAILFAYVVNKLFVFAHRTDSAAGLLKEAASFIGMRLGTMLVELLGVILLSCIWDVNDLAAKLLIQFVVLLLNYLISRFFVFRDGGSEQPPEVREQSRTARRYFLAGFFLTALITAIGFICHGVWPFGDKTVLIVDSLHQYLPFYTDLHQKLVNSESLLYSFSGGFGYNFWSTFAYYMASPVNFLLVLVPVEHVCDFMDLVILLKIAFCGGCFSWYLHKRDPERKYLPAVFGVMFGLSNFVLGYYFNLMWLDSVAVLPLVMYGIEQIVKGKRGMSFCLALFYGLWCNYYIGFMLCVFSCLYFLVCWVCAKRITFRKVFRSCLTFGWYALLAGGMAALVLLPAYLGLSASESMQGNTFPTTVKFYTNFTDMMLNHFVFQEPINISSTQVGLNAYCGVATVLLAILYLFDGKIRLRERLAHYGLAALLLLSFSMNMLNYIWHGFHIQNGLPNRFAFIYIAILLVMAYDALGHIRSFRFPWLLISFLAPAGFVAWVYWTGYQEVEDFICYLTFGILVLWFGLLLLGRYVTALKKNWYFGIAAAVALVEVSANGIHGILENGGVTRSMYVADQTSYQALMKGQGDPAFFRSEVDRQRMRNVTMFAGGYSMIMFNSTMQSSVIDFCDALGIEARTNKNGYLGVTKLMNDVFGIKYLASPSKLADTMYQFRTLAEDGELALYKNDNALSIGFMVRDSIRDWDITPEEPLQVQNSFVTLATGLEPIFMFDRNIEMEDGENYGIRIPEDKQVYLCLDTRVAKIDLKTPEYTKTYNDYTDHLYVINRTAASDMADFTVTLKDNQTSVRAEVYVCANDAYERVISELAKDQLEQVQVSGRKLSGRISVGEAGTLLLTIPYDEGWRIRVDGTEVGFDCIGGALIGVSMTEGEHTLEMEYTPSGLWAGSILSLLCAALCLLTGFLERKLLTAAESEENPEKDSEEDSEDGEAYAYEEEPEYWSEDLLAGEASEDAWKDTGLLDYEAYDSEETGRTDAHGAEPREDSGAYDAEPADSETYDADFEAETEDFLDASEETAEDDADYLDDSEETADDDADFLDASEEIADDDADFLDDAADFEDDGDCAEDPMDTDAELRMEEEDR